MPLYQNIFGHCTYVEFLKAQIAPVLARKMYIDFQNVYTLEAGTLLGASACALYDGINQSLNSWGMQTTAREPNQRLPRFKITTVDIFAGGWSDASKAAIEEHGNGDHIAAAFKLIAAHMKTTEHLPSFGDIAMEKDNSVSFMEDCLDPNQGGARFDFIFLDSDHSYEHVAKEIDIAREILTPTGILAGHDYAPKYPGVVRAVNEAFDKEGDKRNLIFHSGDVWEVKRRGPQ